MMPQEKSVILIVDDSYVSRALLAKIFSAEYQVVEAEDGAEALAKMRRIPDIAAVILDIQMPVMNGYEVLQIMQKDEELRNIPVIVDTASDDDESQLQALDYGAADVLIKPFNSKICRMRVRNTILRQAAAREKAHSELLELQLKTSEMDDKADVYNRRTFCRMAENYIHEHPEDELLFVNIDIDRFKVFNDVFGLTAGDRLLKLLGDVCHTIHAEMIYGRWEADHFVFCLKRSEFHAEEFLTGFSTAASRQFPDFEFVFRIGVYEIQNRELDISLMCDRALLALRSIKEDYLHHIAFYDDSMRMEMRREQEIIGEMEKALESGQFVVYLQPQVDYAGNCLHGAEALVRWIHPERGVISPGEFIPIFEQNGFISKLDEYVWKQTCILIRSWLDEGIPTVPISVNISRHDIYNPRLAEIISGLLKQYQLEPEMLRLEITESAYMEDPRQLTRTVDALRQLGFSVEMDDFGSGYSSLNMLRDVPVDMLKLDMRFLGGDSEDTRGGSILASVVRMAHWIHLPVLAEGVETREQAEYLKSIGCLYMQGYYFYRPIPAKEFKQLLQQKSNDHGRITTFEDDDAAGTADFLSPSAQATLLFNSYVGGAAIIESDGTNIEALRVNDRFIELLGTTMEEYSKVQTHLLDRFDAENQEKFINTIRTAIETEQETRCELCSLPFKPGEEKIYTSINLRCLARNASRYVFYMAMDNITQQVHLQQQNRRLNEHLSAVMNSVPCGIFQFSINHENFYHGTLLEYNDTAWKMMGYRRREDYPQHDNGDPRMADIYPTDIPLFVKTAEQARDADYSERFTCENRMVKQDGSVRWVSTLFQKVKYADDTDSIQIIFSDITDRILPDLDKIIDMLSSMYSVVLLLDFARDVFQIYKTEGQEDSNVVCRNDSIATGTRWIEEHVCEEERAELLKMYTEEYRNQAFEKKEFPTTEFHIVKDGALIPCASTMMKVDNERCFWCMTELSEKKTA